jgi:hypothetical protein
MRPTIGAVGLSTAASAMPNRQNRAAALRRGSRLCAAAAATQRCLLRAMAPSEAGAREGTSGAMRTSPVSGVDAVRLARVGGTCVLSTSA